MPHKNQTYFDLLKILHLMVVVVSVTICVMLTVFRIPALELLGIHPNWLLIWLIAWSLQKTAWEAAIAGFIVAGIYDGIALATPSHSLAFIVVGVLTSRLQKQKYIGEDFISIALIVFFMTLMSEAIFALQYSHFYQLAWAEVLPKYQEIIIVSATITSLWSPIFYYPFSLCQRRIKQLERKVLR